MDKPNLFAQIEMNFFSSVMISIDANFLFWLPSRVILHFKDHVFPTCAQR